MWQLPLWRKVPQKFFLFCNDPLTWPISMDLLRLLFKMNFGSPNTNFVIICAYLTAVWGIRYIVNAYIIKHFILWMKRATYGSRHIWVQACSDSISYWRGRTKRIWSSLGFWDAGSCDCWWRIYHKWTAMQLVKAKGNQLHQREIIPVAAN